jgi:signal recognition particle subunit SRP54
MAQRILAWATSPASWSAHRLSSMKYRRKSSRRKSQNKFDFEDFTEQIGQIKRMGNVKDLSRNDSRRGQGYQDIDTPRCFMGIEAIINSMTPFERSNPETIGTSRRKRIAKAAGKTSQRSTHS